MKPVRAMVVAALAVGSFGCHESTLIGGPGPASTGTASGGASATTGSGGGGAAGAALAGVAGAAGGGDTGSGGAPGAGGAKGGGSGASAVDPTNSAARVVFFYTPLGTVLDAWRPSVSASGAPMLTGILQPLQPFQDRVLIVDGIDNLAGAQTAASTEQGPALLLTGKAGGISLGQAIAGSWSQTTVFPSLQLGVQTSAVLDFQPLPLLASNDLSAETQRFFGGLSSMPRPTFATSGDFAADGRQQMDVVQLVLKLDLSRIVTLAWSDTKAPQVLKPAGATRDYRTLALGSGVPGPERDQFLAAQTWFASQFAYLLAALAAVPAEGGTSLLDHTLVVWISETGEASSGLGKNVPVVIAGNLNGRFRQGAYVRTAGSQANLLATIATAAGLSGAFGDPALGNAPLPELLNP